MLRLVYKTRLYIQTNREVVSPETFSRKVAGSIPGLSAEKRLELIWHLEFCWVYILKTLPYRWALERGP
jgi:hypothetical protein